MGSVRAELLKLKRSSSWAVVVALPLAAVASGAGNTVLAGEPLTDGWHTLWMRVVVVYGLFPLATGVAVLGSLVWRADHRGGNRNALMGRPVSALEAVVGKLAAVAVLAAAMQAVLTAGVVAAGKAVFGLPGPLPGQYLLISVLIVVVCLPVAALQSGLSMLMESFAAPVAVGLAGSVGGLLLVLLRFDAVSLAVPYGLTARATQVGTGAFMDAGTVTVGTLASMAVWALVSTVLVTVATAALLDRRDAG
ncbi:ABC transporter permease [Nocardiopsis suaedae]|uniref:ABC transporter permease n=1 Tax=Nocardiopsis suaedae TaxID=3018444 RepID=A0ABT4TQ50_9ACTN|nr:ABC transporter permease [Nocardiopsis suaedae]MDA2806791.1 ABC transporter permease [Nocardiopsis suaedae]